MSTTIEVPSLRLLKFEKRSVQPAAPTPAALSLVEKIGFLSEFSPEAAEEVVDLVDYLLALIDTKGGA